MKWCWRLNCNCKNVKKLKNEELEQICKYNCDPRICLQCEETKTLPIIQKLKVCIVREKCARKGCVVDWYPYEDITTVPTEQATICNRCRDWSHWEKTHRSIGRRTR